MGFELVGVRPCFRTGDECAVLDKKAADAAFRRYKRERLDPFLKAQGFHKYKTNAYVRRSGIDLLEYIDLQKEHYGSKTFTVNLAVMPLYTSAYEPRGVVAFYVSHRLGELICRKDLWWDSRTSAPAQRAWRTCARRSRSTACRGFTKWRTSAMFGCCS